jgi:hypothetical protein
LDADHPRNLESFARCFTTLSFRIEPSLKEALRIAAEQEHRSIANMVEVMIREYCGRVGVGIAEQAPASGVRASAKSFQKKSPQAKKNT